MTRELSNDYTIPESVEFSAVGEATSFGEYHPHEVSRYYWTRGWGGTNLKAKRFFSATHSGFMGAPTYAADGPSIFNQTGDPEDWLAGYTDDLDIVGSIAIDRWFRNLGQMVGVPIFDVDDYDFDNLISDEWLYGRDED